MNESHHRLALPQGTRIQNFEFHRVLGQGGFGITYLGWNLTLDIPVAIKEYLPSDFATRESDMSVVPQSSQVASDFAWGLDDFLKEARRLAQFKHPNIVRVHHLFEAHGTAYIVMDYVEGETLSSFLQSRGTLSEEELKAILYPLLDGLQDVHRANFLHRDIKPLNIIIRDEDHSPVLIDFGAARQAIGIRSQSIDAIISPPYSPIEQYSSRGKHGPETDIYALGAVCYRALVGEGPEEASVRAGERIDPFIPAVERCVGQASEEFLSAIDWSLRLYNEDRPQSIAEWRKALEEKPPPPPPPGSKKPGKKEKIGTSDETDEQNSIGNQPESKKAVSRLNMWFRGGICISYLVFTLPFIAVFFNQQDTTPFAFSIFLIIGLLCGCCILHKLWSLIPAEDAKTTPGKAVGFLFVPFFNLYWNFIAIYGLAEALNSQMRRRGIKNKKISKGLCLSFCISFTLFIIILLFLCLIVLFLDNIRPIESFLALLFFIAFTIVIVIGLMIFGQMKDTGIVLLNGDKQDRIPPIHQPPGGGSERGKKSKGKLFAIVAYLFTFTLLIGGGYYYQYEYLPTQHRQAQEAAEAEVVRERTDRGSALLSAASEDLSSDRLTSPSGANAWEKYQAVLALEPENKKATAGLDSIIGRYVSKFDVALRVKEFAEAEGYVSRIRGVYADAPVLSDLEDRLSGAREAERARQAAEAERQRQEKIAGYKGKFEAALNHKDFDEAEGYVDSLRAVNADGAMITRLSGRLSATRDAEQRVGRRFKDCVDCPEMVVVPSGSFMMGSPSGEYSRDDDEGPRHWVTIDYPLAVGVYEVTFSEWQACVSDGGCGGYVPDDEGWGRGNRPVLNVSWHDAQSYVRWLSSKTSHSYGLLSESEWEYVARAGTETRYSWGNEIGRNRANCDGCGSRWDDNRTAPVGSFSANVWDVHDMHGNVWEWVEDCWNDRYFGAPADGSAWETGNCGLRVLRGGSWLNRPWYLRSASRAPDNADRWFGSVGNFSGGFGFRIVRRF